MSLFADLHLHTYYSDGRRSPAEVLADAARLGLRALALTDHDNARGAREAAPLARALGLELIPGIEFTCYWDGYRPAAGDPSIDMLGYFIDLFAPRLQALEQAALDDIYERVDLCCKRLTNARYPVTLADAFAENERYAGVQQLAQALVRRGYAPAVWSEALALVRAYWEPGRPSATPVAHVIETIHAAGGVAVLAHPGAKSATGELISSDQLAGLVEMGLDGLEIYHFALDESARTHFLALAHRFDLVISGGSDEHGWHPEHDRTGTEPVDERMVAGLRERARRYRS